jgi:pSer/pThr/pTyr-binding forkhead associated (FHA) protein
MTEKRPEDAVVTLDQLPKGTRPAALFTVLSGPSAGEQFRVEDAVVFGRGSDLSTCFDETGVSGQHVRLWCSAQGAFLLEDLKSTNGTFVNDVRIERRALVVGDRVRLGPGLELRFELHYSERAERSTPDVSSDR